MGFGDYIKELRIKRGFTQKYVSEQLGVTQAAYAQYELSGKTPNMFTAVKLAKLLGTTVEDMATGTSRKENTTS